jgi:hypothetical protein
VTAVKKLAEAETLLARIHGTNNFLELTDFIKTMHDVFSHLLGEYNKKFDLKIDRIGLDKFKVRAKKLGKIDAIRFLIWYEKEYHQIKDDADCGYLLDKNSKIISDDKTIGACSILLNKAKKLVYDAYENF